MMQNNKKQIYSFFNGIKINNIHKICLIFLLYLAFFNTAFAIQQNGEPTVTEKKITVNISTSDVKQVKLSVYDSNNTIKLGPLSVSVPNTAGGDTLDVSITGLEGLIRETSYTLKIKDSGSNDSIAVPFITVPQNTIVNGITSTTWYYSSEFEIDAFYDTDRAKSFHSFKTESLCIADWQKAINDYYTGKTTGGLSRADLRYTTCFTLPQLPTKGQFIARMNPPGTFNATKDIFYYTWWYGNTVTDWMLEGPFETLPACTNSEKANIYIVVEPCSAYKKPPVQPVDWDRIRQDSLNAHSQLISGKNGKIGTGDSTYTLLAPIGDLKEINSEMDISKYINLMFKIFLGLCGALAVIMIIIYGIQWMGTDSVFGKTEAKSNIGSAVGGLLLALGAWMILNTINPDLLGGTLNIPALNIVLTADEQNFANTEGAAAQHLDYKIAGTSFAAPNPSPGVQNLADKLKLGYKLTKIRVYPNALGVNKDRTYFLATKAGSPNISATVNSGNGVGGFSELGKVEQNKTPRGKFKVGENGSRMEISTSTDKAILTRDGKFNLGAAFVGINALDDQGQNRRIGFHGKWNNDETAGTNGCIRMKNDDLILLAQYMIRDLPQVDILE